jgi:hypothetical protein
MKQAPAFNAGACFVFSKSRLFRLQRDYVLVRAFKLIAFASTAGGLRTCNGAPFASFKKDASLFLNPDFVVTEPKKAPYAGTGDN